MKLVHKRLWRSLVNSAMLCALVLTLLPQSLFAQEGSISIYLPQINGGLGQSENPDQPFTGFDERPEEQLETSLLAEAASALPEPAQLAATPGAPATSADQDLDADGVRNEADNCPHQPNPPVNGVQPELCGYGLVAEIDHLVFLQSRIFRPTAGLDPALKNTQKRERIHVLLHVRPHQNGVMLSAEERVTLQSLGVNFLGYLPHNSYFVSLPRNLDTLRQIVALEDVVGISALRPQDKVAPQVRLQGPTEGRNGDGTLSFDVDFFDDVPHEQIEALLTQAGIGFEWQYDNTYRVTLSNWQSLRHLIIQDIVYFVDDLPDPVYNRTQNAQALINGPIVSNTLGLRGNGIVVSMTELGLAKPVDRPEVNGRVILGNNPIFETVDDEEHAQMVSAILIADESTFPTRAGLLPEATLSSFAVPGLTLKAQHYGVNKDAHDDYGAILSNNSWGPYKCAKAGEYRKRGKFFDRAVYDVGINIVYAVGNSRGPDSEFGDLGCPAQLFSLPHPVAKNDISVGNWDIASNSLQETSSAGPAADGRLKPDLVAPGQGVETIGWNESTLQSEEILGGGTSAAAPVTSGVIGWIAESFVNQGMILDSIMPARYKAILIHTAKDVGAAGPDFFDGYGLIQADRALRIAQEWNDWGREGTVNETTTQMVFPFDVDSPMTFYKATLVWDDEEGENSSTLALKNDLDLTLISPSGAIFYPYDTVLPAGATFDDGSVPCLASTCQDRLNNVEMVMANPDNSDFIEQGTWQAVVDTHRLVSDEQNFSLVLTPPCPVEIDSSVTLTENINCEPNSLQPSGVLITKDGVNLDCDNHTIQGNDAGALNFDGTYAGVRVLANDVVVRNCEIHRFDVGIKVGDDNSSPTNTFSSATLRRNTISNVGTVGIDLVGNGHLAINNSISQLIDGAGRGIVVSGDQVTLDQNEFYTARNGGGANNTIAILVLPGSNSGTITANSFDGGWWYGIRLRSLDPLKPVGGFLVDSNTFEGIERIPIELWGAVRNTTVSNNHVTAYGDGWPGINVIANEDAHPKNNDINSNTVTGFSNQGQLGIQLIDSYTTTVQYNTLSTVRIGISEQDAKNTFITRNIINPDKPNDNYRTFTGILSTNNYTATNINYNEIYHSLSGVVLIRPAATANIAENIIVVSGLGIAVAGARGASLFRNTVDAHAGGIAIVLAPEAHINNNGITMHANGPGIVAGLSNNALIINNDIISPTTGIQITTTAGISVNNNLVDNPAVTGIILDQDSGGQLYNNTIDDSLLGIHYQAGQDASIAANTVNLLAGGVGIRLGTGEAGCPVNVNNVMVRDNILNGGAIGVDVLCDVGTYADINN